eukprot:5451562-Amphidinium_carterae.1
MSDESAISVALLGFGNANRAFAQLLLERLNALSDAGIRIHVVGVFTGKSGSAWSNPGVSEHGLPLAEVLAQRLSPTADWLRNFKGSYKAGCLEEGGTLAALVSLREAHLLDAVIEATPADYLEGKPAVPIIRELLKLGVHVASANKVPVVLAHDELKAIASAAGCRYLFESACMDGIPVFNMARRCLPTARVLGFEGILNSTTNVILSAMEESSEVTFEEGLQRAQDMGIVEADPSGDIDGYDAAVKCVCLARALMGAQASMKDVRPLDGIRTVDQAAVAGAKERRSRLMLVCRGWHEEDGVRCSVELQTVPSSSPFHGIRGASSCLTIYTDVLGALTLTQTDPTIRDTGFGLLADFLEAINWPCKA